MAYLLHGYIWCIFLLETVTQPLPAVACAVSDELVDFTNGRLLVHLLTCTE